MGKETSFQTIEGCRFCYEKIKNRVLAEVGSVIAIKDRYPVSDAHLLLIPKNHSENYFELSNDEKKDVDQLLLQLRVELLKNDLSITGFNIGINCGESAGQTIFHTHIHLIPRRDGDTPNPRGGVRGVIPDKMGY